jgi:hypothetical protein
VTRCNALHLLSLLGYVRVMVGKGLERCVRIESSLTQ